LGSYDGAAARRRKSGRFWTEDRRLWILEGRSWWGTNETGRNWVWKETDGSGKRGRGNKRGLSVKFWSVAGWRPPLPGCPGWRVLVVENFRRLDS
jgi:hypothetical protein